MQLPQDSATSTSKILWRICAPRQPTGQSGPAACSTISAGSLRASGARHAGHRETIAKPTHKAGWERPGFTRNGDCQVAVLAQEPAGMASCFGLRAGMGRRRDQNPFRPIRFGTRFDAGLDPAHRAVIAAGIEMRATDTDEGEMPYRLEWHETQRDMQFPKGAVGVSCVGREPAAADPAPGRP